MKASDVRAKTADELKDQLVDLKKEQFNLRFQQATQQLEKPARVKEVRRDIDRVMNRTRRRPIITGRVTLDDCAGRVQAAVKAGV